MNLSFRNPITRFRRYLITRYIKATVAVDTESLSFFWQPLLLILIKLAVVAYLSVRFYSLYPFLGTWLRKGFEFFQLHEIYNFRFPKKTFFDSVSEILLLLVIAYYGLPFCIRQIQGVFSSLIINRGERKLYYIKSSVIVRDIYIFLIPEIHHFVLKQNLLTRLLSIGTIVLEKRTGEQVVIRSLYRAPRILKALAELKD